MTTDGAVLSEHAGLAQLARGLGGSELWLEIKLLWRHAPVINFQL